MWARVGEVLPGGVARAGRGLGSAQRRGKGRLGDRMGLRACAGRRELGGGEGGAISPSLPPLGAGWREIAWAGFLGRVGDEGWGCAGRAGRAMERLGARTWRGGGVGASQAEETGLRPAETQGEGKGGTLGCEGGEQSEEAGEHGGSGGTWDMVFLVYTKWLRRARVTG